MTERTIHAAASATDSGKLSRMRECVAPFFDVKRQAIDYALHGGRIGPIVLRIYDEQGNVEREIEPPKEEQMLYAAFAA